MSLDSKVLVYKLSRIEPHPNADKVSFHILEGLENYPCISQNGQYQIGDLVLYIPVDMICPDTPEYSFLGHKESERRIRAKKIRGLFSMGLLSPIPKDLVGQVKEGDDVTEILGFKKWDPDDSKPQHKGGGTILPGANTNQPTDFIIPYYDIENLRRFTKYMSEIQGDIILTEKVHGANSSFVYWDKLYVKSRSLYKDPEGEGDWSQIARDYHLDELLKEYPKKVLFGEIYGRVQNLKYGKPNEVDFIAFDVLDLERNRFLDWADYLQFIENLNKVARENGWKEIKTTPLLYKGPWTDFETIKEYAEGKTLVGGDHCREGFVLRPEKEIFHYRYGRIIFKLIGEGYHLRK